MAYQDLHEFLMTLSKHPAMRRIMKRGGEAAEELMSQAGLTKKEKQLVRDRDEAAIRKYLGDQYAAASMINIVG